MDNVKMIIDSSPAACSTKNCKRIRNKFLLANITSKLFFAVELKSFQLENEKLKEKNSGKQFYVINSFITTLLLQILKFLYAWKVL